MMDLLVLGVGRSNGLLPVPNALVIVTLLLIASLGSCHLESLRWVVGTLGNSELKQLKLLEILG